MKSLEVRYFKVVFKGMIESHFAKSTEDFYDWLRLFKEIDPNTRVAYIEFENGFSLSL